MSSMGSKVYGVSLSEAGERERRAEGGESKETR
jgi:hypothetical protein